VGALAGVAVGAGVLFSAQASSFEILAPQFGMKAATTTPDDAGTDSGPSGAAQVTAAPATHDGPIAGHVEVRTASAASESIPANLRDGMTALADAAQAKFADAPVQDASMPSLVSGRGESDGASTSAESFADRPSAGLPAVGGPGAAGEGGGGLGGGGLGGAASGLPDAQSAAGADQAANGGLNSLQPPQDAVTSAAGVPEPATWTILILGFGLVGATLRRPRKARGPA
jgi:hypothetical protein